MPPAIHFDSTPAPSQNAGGSRSVNIRHPRVFVFARPGDFPLAPVRATVEPGPKFTGFSCSDGPAYFPCSLANFAYTGLDLRLMGHASGLRLSASRLLEIAIVRVGFDTAGLPPAERIPG